MRAIKAGGVAGHDLRGALLEWWLVEQLKKEKKSDTSLLVRTRNLKKSEADEACITHHQDSHSPSRPGICQPHHSHEQLVHLHGEEDHVSIGGYAPSLGEVSK